MRPEWTVRSGLVDDAHFNTTLGKDDRYARTYSNDVSVLIVQSREPSSLLPPNCDGRQPEFGDAAPERSGIGCEGMDWREAIEDDGRDQSRKICTIASEKSFR